MHLTEVLVSNKRHESKQLTLDFDAKGNDLRAKAPISDLRLVIDNTVITQQAEAELEPNSPEISKIIRSLGESLSW